MGCICSSDEVNKIPNQSEKDLDKFEQEKRTKGEKKVIKSTSLSRIS